MKQEIMETLGRDLDGSPEAEEVGNTYDTCVETLDNEVTFSLKVSVAIAISVGVLLGILSFVGVVSEGLDSVAIFSLTV